MVLVKASSYPEQHSLYQFNCKIAEQEEKTFAELEKPRIFLDIAAGVEPVGRVVIEVDSQRAPLTSANFLALCTGSHIPLDKRLHFESTTFHRIVTGMYLCGGDVVNGNGSGGYSIYGNNFKDEETGLSHDKAGVVSMFSHGPNTNNSQFIITLKPLLWMDDVFIPFGKVVSGLDLLLKLSEVYGSESGIPHSNAVRIIQCGRVV